MDQADRLSNGDLRHTLKFPAVPGPVSLDQINDADRAALRTIAAGRHSIVDVGTFLGGSAEAMLEGMPEDGRLVTIDTFAGLKNVTTGQLLPEAMLGYAIGRLRHFGDRVTIAIGDSKQTATWFAPASVDLVFLDAAHDYANVKADIVAWLPIVKTGGLLAGHDFDQEWGLDMNQAEIIRRSDKDWDRESGVHCGVIHAVMDAFAKVEHAADIKSSVWIVQPEWKRT